MELRAEPDQSCRKREDQNGFFRDLFEYAPDGYLVTRADGTIIAANRAAVRLLAVTGDALIGKDFSLFVDEQNLPAFRDLIERLGRVDEAQAWDGSLSPATGNPFEASITVAPTTGADGRNTRFYWLIRDESRRRHEEAALRRAHNELDARIKEQNRRLAKTNEELRIEIAERSRAENQIKQQNEFLNHILESLPHPFYVLDASDYTIKMANSAAALGELTEHTTCYALTHRRSLPCDGSEHTCPLQMVKETKKPVIVEHVHFDKEGNPRNVEVHGYPIFDERGNVTQMIEYSLDITERKELERELRSNAEKIKMFAYTISHDLKSPLIGIHGLVQLLRKQYQDLLDDRGKKYCDQIVKASKQVVALIEELNVYIRTKETPVDFEELNPREILHTIRDEFSPLLGMRGIDWVEPEHMPRIKADKLSLLRVFRNLVDNALKYGGDELGEIRIGYREGEEFHTFSVSDNGIGIDKKDCESIFELFQRNQTSKGIEGTGLGLAIVKEIAIKHGGEVWAKPAPQGGVAFYISISKTL